MCEENGISTDIYSSAMMGVGPIMGTRILSLWRVQPAASKVQNQGARILESVRKTEGKTAEGVELLKEIRDFIAKSETIVKSVQDSADVLYKDYDLGPMHGALDCKFSQACKKYPTILLKIRSTPSAKAIIRQNQLMGSDCLGALSFILPFESNTSKAKFQYLHERLSFNASVGLSFEPELKLAALVGSKRASGGGCLGFNMTDGSVSNLEIGSSIKDQELGTFSTLFNLVNDGSIDAKHGSYKAFYSKRYKNNTFSAEIDYKFVEKEAVNGEVDSVPTVVATGGVLHQYDSGLMLKAKFSSTGHVSGMIQFSEGLADSIVRASVQVDLRHLNRPPRVGFSISSDPTK